MGGRLQRHLRFAPTAFLERLAELAPRQRVNLVLSFGVLAPHAAWRSGSFRAAAGNAGASGEVEGAERASTAGAPGRRWADLMRRAFEVNVLACPRCGGRLRLLALEEAGVVTARILRHLGCRQRSPAARPARAPPLPGGDDGS